MDEKRLITYEDYKKRKLHPMDELYVKLMAEQITPEQFESRDPHRKFYINEITGDLTEIKTPEDMKRWIMGMKHDWDYFERNITERMTRARAERVFDYRVTKNYSWRLLAATIWKQWKDSALWTPPSHQLAGVILCATASRLLSKKID